MIPVAALLAVLAMPVVGGCGKPGVPAEQFVGTWRQMSEDGSVPSDSPTLVLRSDATGTMDDPPNPRPKSIIWVVRGEKLVLTPRDGGSRLNSRYRFEGPDQLSLSTEYGEFTYERVE
jgi:hypothetical protein